jgi:hypothetical protein
MTMSTKRQPLRWYNTSTDAEPFESLNLNWFQPGLFAVPDDVRCVSTTLRERCPEMGVALVELTCACGHDRSGLACPQHLPEGHAACLLCAHDKHRPHRCGLSVQRILPPPRRAS